MISLGEVRWIKAALGEMDWVIGDPSLGGFVEDGGFREMQVVLRVAEPQRGYKQGIQSEEPVLIRFDNPWSGFPPSVYAKRDGFPCLLHSSQSVHGICLCLTRNEPCDWWVGKTVADVVVAAKRWLDRAAAGDLALGDDPFEPLILPDSSLFIEAPEASPILRKARQKGISKGRTAVIGGVGRKQRLIVGLEYQDSIPTMVMFQTIRQTYCWPYAPETLEDLGIMLDAFGLPAIRLQMFARGQAEKALLLVGILRRKEILNVHLAEEWVGFLLERRQETSSGNSKAAPKPSEWGVQPHKVRFSFSTKLARRANGWKEIGPPARIVVIGAGAMGSALCETLARSGLTNVHILDHDLLEPHNLARHTLGFQDLGTTKATSLADKCNFLFMGEKVAIATPLHVLTGPVGLMAKMLNEMDLILDCSASLAVQKWIGALPRPRPRAVCAYQIAGGKGTVLLAEGGGSGISLEAIEPMLLYQERCHPIIREWTQQDPETLQIGAGCRAPSARLPGSLVGLGANWAAHALLEWINSGQFPVEAGYGIATATMEAPGIPPTLASFWKTAPFEAPMETEGWKVFISCQASQRIREEARAHSPEETGGVLVGEVDRQHRTFYIVDAWGAPPDSEATTVGFARGRKGLLARLILLSRNTGGRINYAGEWHSHPNAATSMSARDSRTAEEMALLLESAQLPALCIIANAIELEAHAVIVASE